jgi:hypothetical protein
MLVSAASKIRNLAQSYDPLMAARCKTVLPLPTCRNEQSIQQTNHICLVLGVLKGLVLDFLVSAVLNVMHDMEIGCKSILGAGIDIF